MLYSFEQILVHLSIFMHWDVSAVRCTNISVFEMYFRLNWLKTKSITCCEFIKDWYLFFKRISTGYKLDLGYKKDSIARRTTEFQENEAYQIKQSFNQWFFYNLCENVFLFVWSFSILKYFFVLHRSCIVYMKSW